ncbi:MAG: hypothetical protein ABI361_06205 [Nitrososphaera sp.]
MSSDSGPMSSHNGYRLDYKAGSGPQSGSLALRLSLVTSDAGTNQSIRSTSYLVKIDRVNQTAQSNATGTDHPQVKVVDTVFGDNVFLTNNGNLTLNLRSSPSAQPGSQPVIHADVDPILNAWLTDPSNTIAIDNLRMVPGSYHASVQLYGVDTPQCQFSNADSPKYDVYWNVDSNGSVSALSSTAVPEFGMSQIILVLSLSGVIGLVALLRTRLLAR